ncbi:MAG: hypothetical protein ACLQF0_05630 [Dissulfurispiraceae bacterium]
MYQRTKHFDMIQDSAEVVLQSDFLSPLADKVEVEANLSAVGFSHRHFFDPLSFMFAVQA